MDDYEPDFEFHPEPEELKNRFFIGLNGSTVDVRVDATSEEMAIAIYKALEKFLIAGARVDLEVEWQKDSDRPYPVNFLDVEMASTITISEEAYKTLQESRDAAWSLGHFLHKLESAIANREKSFDEVASLIQSACKQSADLYYQIEDVYAAIDK